MDSLTLRDHQKRYRRCHHHAWAGGIMLSLVLALRLLVEISGATIDDRIILILGAVLIAYISGALALTYYYRSGLDAEERVPEHLEQIRLEAEIAQERLRSEEAIAKAEAKAKKKTAKAAAKTRKKALQEQNKNDS